MCAECGEGPSLLGGLECSFPLGHCSLKRGCWNTTHCSNSTARLEKKQERAFASRNLLCSEMLYLAGGEKMKSLVWGSVVASPCPGEGFNNSFPLHGEGCQCLQILPCARSSWEGAGEGRVQLHLSMAWSCCSDVNAAFVDSLAALYLSEIQSCPAYLYACACAVPSTHAVAEQTHWVLQWLQMQFFTVNGVRNLGKRKRQNTWAPNLVLPMWLFLLCCFQKLYHTKISNSNSSYCQGDVQRWADGGGAATARARGRCGHTLCEFGEEEEWWRALSRAVSLN